MPLNNTNDRQKATKHHRIQQAEPLITYKTKLKLDREVGGECFLETFEFKMVD